MQTFTQQLTPRERELAKRACQVTWHKNKRDLERAARVIVLGRRRRLRVVK